MRKDLVQEGPVVPNPDPKEWHVFVSRDQLWKTFWASPTLLVHDITHYYNQLKKWVPANKISEFLHI